MRVNRHDRSVDASFNMASFWLQVTGLKRYPVSIIEISDRMAVKGPLQKRRGVLEKPGSVQTRLPSTPALEKHGGAPARYDPIASP